MSLTTMSTVSVALPPVLVAVMVYVVKSEITVGVPLSSPVDGSKVRPVGRDGDIDQVRIAPPPTVGVVAVIGEFLVSTNEFGV